MRKDLLQTTKEEKERIRLAETLANLIILDMFVILIDFLVALLTQ